MMTRSLRPFAAVVVLVGAAGLFADDANKPKAETKTDDY